MRTKSSVCYQCEDRHAGCHSSCEKYRAEVQENYDRQERAAKEIKRIYDHRTFRGECIRRVTKE